MVVSPDTAQGLIQELYLMGPAMRAVLLHPEEGRLLPGGAGVLAALDSRGPCRQVDLAGDLCISASVLSRHVADLVAGGYVSRQADPDDGRASLVRVTGEGRELLDRVRASRARGMQRALAGWSEEDAERAFHVLRELRTAFAAHAATHTHRIPAPVSVPDAPQSQETDV